MAKQFVFEEQRSENLPAIEQTIRREAHEEGSRRAAIRFANEHGLVLDRRVPWRWVNMGTTPNPGVIHGLPMSQGRPTITDGVIVIIERGDGSLYYGHLQFLEPVPGAHADFSPKRAARAAKTQGAFYDYE